VQVVGEMHETPLSMLDTPAGSGVAWIVQVVAAAAGPAAHTPQAAAVVKILSILPWLPAPVAVSGSRSLP
jgi:hypothetical protein